MRIEGEIDVQLTVDDCALRVTRLAGTAALSTLFSFVVEATDEGAKGAAEERLGKPCVLTITPVVGPALVVHGIVRRLHAGVVEVGHEVVTEHTIEIAPAVSALTVGRDHRYFQDLDAPAIVEKVVADAGCEASFEITGSYRKRAYTVQYGESDWTFVERICAEEGIGYRFDFAEGETKLVFFDDSTSAPAIAGDTIALQPRSALESDADAVYDVAVRRDLVSDQVVFRDYDPKKPALDQNVEVDDGSKKLPVYDAPGRYTTPAEGKALGKRRLEALRARKCTVSGRSTALRLVPGAKLGIENASRPPLDAPLLVLSLGVRVDLRDDANQGRFEVTFQAIPADTPYRPAPAPAARIVDGPQTATVAGPPGKELHTDDAGSVRAQFHWDRVGKKDDASTTFMRVGQFAVGNSMVRPRIGWQVLVEHHVGDVDQPFLWSHLYDGAHPPPYALPANKTRTSWQTATTPGDGTSNEIRFEDKKGSEEIFLNASKDMTVVVGDSKTKKIGNNHKHDISSNLEVKVGSNRSLTVAADQKVEVGASETLTVSGSRSTAIGGDETVTVGASRTVIVTSGKTLDADGGRTMTVGAAMLGISALGVNRAVLGSASVTVGGAWISAAATGLANVTAGAGAETVGGVKLQVGAGGVTLKVVGALAEAVGAAYVNAAGGNFSEAATGALSVTVGGAFVGNAPEIEIEADSEIKIVCGGSSLTITSSCIELKSPAIPLLAGSVAKTGSQIHHNP